MLLLYYYAYHICYFSINMPNKPKKYDADIQTTAIKWGEEQTGAVFPVIWSQPQPPVCLHETVIATGCSCPTDMGN